MRRHSRRGDKPRRVNKAQVQTAALGLLARREYSALELADKLRQRFRGCLWQSQDNFSEPSISPESSEDTFEESTLDHSECIENAIGDCLQKLKADGYLNDERFAEAYVRSRLGRGLGQKRILRELVEKGIQFDVAEDFVSQGVLNWSGASDPDHMESHQLRDSERQRARDLADRKYPNFAEDAKTWGRAARFLQRRGFDFDVIRSALGQTPRASVD